MRRCNYWTVGEKFSWSKTGALGVYEWLDLSTYKNYEIEPDTINVNSIDSTILLSSCNMKYKIVMTILGVSDLNGPIWITDVVETVWAQELFFLLMIGEPVDLTYAAHERHTRKPMSM